MLINNTYHLGYCTNIHPGEDWNQTWNSLKAYLPKIKKQVSPDRPFGVGLRLSNLASLELQQENRLQEFKDWLHDEELYIFTMNGFPYGNFHNQRVKDMVHAPDWTTLERLDYTKRLFDQLAFLLPDGISGGISTSPISYKHWHNSDTALNAAFTKGAENMIEIVLQLIEIEKSTGKQLHLDIEPEPDGMLENSDEVLHFFQTYLIPMGTKTIVKRLGCSESQAVDRILAYIRVCYDTCHFSLAYEEPEYTLDKFKKVGIRVGKIQVSSALKIVFKDGDNEEVWNSLSRFNEPIYLHQVTEKIDGKVSTITDLPQVLKERKTATELRAHFHVPIFLERYEQLYATQDQILKVLAYLEKDRFSDALEIETYTWDVLPTDLKLELSESIIREINWLRNKL